MREIKIHIKTIEQWIENPIGKELCIPVKVGWEELQLTEEQILANAVAFVKGTEQPYPDQSIFNITINKEE